MFSGSLIRSGNNAKTVKGDGVYETAIMYLAPANMARTERTMCSMAVLAGCIAGCLNTAGRGAFSNVQQARVNKTLRYLDGREMFLADLVTDLAAFVRYCRRGNVIPAVRLNGTSDIQWEVGHPVSRDGVEYASIFEAFPEVQFYDYTKIAKRVLKPLPANYALTLSYSAANSRYSDMIINAALASGANVAVVYRTKASRDALLKTGFSVSSSTGATLSRSVIDGDETDMRFMDPKGVIVGLYAKGRAGKADKSGFVVDC
jgi:hypothetical protein